MVVVGEEGEGEEEAVCSSALGPDSPRASLATAAPEDFGPLALAGKISRLTGQTGGWKQRVL